MIGIGFLNRIFNRHKELEFMLDLDWFKQTTNRIHMKRLAIEICISFLARTISQSEFRVRDGNKYLKNEIYYRLNTRPNKNQTASTFWEKFIYKMIYDNEVLVIQANDDDLLIADSFQQRKYAIYENIFSNVLVGDYEFNDTFRQSEVIHLKYKNDRLTPLIDGLFSDYGELFGRVIAAQKRKSQIRATVNMDMITSKNKDYQAKLQEFINNMYKAIEENDVAIIPQQKGFEYEEQSGKGISGQSVDEINKVTDGFLDHIAFAIGIPPSLIRGDMVDVDKQTKNYMFFTVSPLLNKIKDEIDVKLFTKQEHLNGREIEIMKPTYRDVFDLSTAIDKLISSGAFNGNEIRSLLGYETTDEEIHESYFITKNYQTADEAVKGGESE